MARLRLTWMFGLMAFMLLVAGCVEMEWETVVGSDGHVEHTTFRFITDNEEIFTEAWDDLQKDRAEHEALHPYLQVSNNSEGNKYVIEVAADIEGARQSGIDLEAITRNSSSLEVLYDVLEGTGVDPETGLVYADYVFTPSEEFSDPFLRLLMADMGYSGPVMRAITHMPGEIVNDVERNDAKVTRITPSTLQTEIALTELNRTLAFRIEANPLGEQAVEPSSVVVMEVPVDSEITPVEPEEDEAEPSTVEVRGWEPFARSPEPPRVIEHVNLSRLFQEPFTGSTRMQLTETIFVQDVSVHEDGLIGPELVGEIINEGPDSFRWVGLGVAFFDVNGQLVEYQTLMIPNVEAGQRRGFKKYLYKANIEEAVTYRVEWNYSF